MFVFSAPNNHANNEYQSNCLVLPTFYGCITQFLPLFCAHGSCLCEVAAERDLQLWADQYQPVPVPVSGSRRPVGLRSWLPIQSACSGKAAEPQALSLLLPIVLAGVSKDIFPQSHG